MLVVLQETPSRLCQARRFALISWSLRNQVWFRKRKVRLLEHTSGVLLCTFVDAATDWIKVCLVRDAPGESTIDAKEAFERAAAERGVVIKGYHADNGRYA